VYSPSSILFAGGLIVVWLATMVWLFKARWWTRQRGHAEQKEIAAIEDPLAKSIPTSKP
jgi:hypothetical protein